MSEIKIIDNTVFSTETRRAIDSLQTAVGQGYEFIDSIVQPSTVVPKCSWEALGSPQEASDGVFYAEKQKIRLVGNLSDFSSHDQWKAFLRQVIPSQNIINHACDIPKVDPVDSNNVGPSTQITSSFVHNISFYEYERVTRLVSTRMLPNYSAMQYYNRYAFNLNLRHPSYRDYLTASVGLGVGMQIESPTEVETYYNNYLSNINLISNNSRPQVDQNTNIFILSDHADYDTSSDSTNNLPHYLKYKLLVSSTDDLSLESYVDNTKKRKQLFNFVATAEPLLLGFTDHEGFGQNIKTYNFLEFISSLNAEKFSPASDQLYIHNYSEVDEGTAIERMVENIMLYAGALETAQTNMRNIEGIWSNESCKKDILGFKIEKFLDTTNGSPAQTIYMFGNEADLIDTQLKYDQRYIYKISVLVMVMGSQYSYANAGHTTVDGGFVNLSTGASQEGYDVDTLNHWYGAEVEVIVKPSIQIMEIPLDERKEHFIALPPCRPEVSFTNESGKNSEIKIHLSNNFGINEEHYSIVSKQDKLNLESIGINQNIDSTLVKTSFLYNSGRFEIFRMDRPPASLQQFDANFLTDAKEDELDHLTIGTYGLNDSGGEDKRLIWEGVDSMASGYNKNRFAHSTVFKDFILSNRKYYYLFRALTESGVPSPASEIYQVELIEDSDESRVEVSIYNIPEEKDFQYNKLMKRFFQIIPNPLQTQINNESIAGYQSAEEGEPNLGELVTESVFNKKFKIRITSEHTGKKIDFNIVFKKTME